MKGFYILFVLTLYVLKDMGSACNSYYGGHGLFGDDYGHGYPHVHGHMHGPGYYGNQYGHHHGGLMDSLFRTDIDGSHGHHHAHRHPLIPISHHRHVHRVHRRSVHSRRFRTTST